MKKYNKLVRDFIPEVIEADGKKCETEIVYGEEKTKFLEDKNLEELADVMEVLFGLAHNLGYTEEDLLNKRKEKLEERGGFKEGIVLKKVY